MMTRKSRTAYNVGSLVALNDCSYVYRGIIIRDLVNGTNTITNIVGEPQAECAALIISRVVAMKSVFPASTTWHYYVITPKTIGWTPSASIAR